MEALCKFGEASINDTGALSTVMKPVGLTCLLPGMLVTKPECGSS